MLGHIFALELNLNNMKYLFLILLLTTMVYHQAVAQSKESQNSFDIEADPIAFILKGYSFHIGYMVSHVRFDAGFYGIEQPSSFVGNDKFSIFSSGIGIKADYYFQNNKGLFTGLQSDYYTDKITLKVNDNTQTINNISIGLRGGYRVVFGNKERNNFYLVPWVALIYSPNAEKIFFGQENYQQSAWSVFPTLHVGYRF